MLEAPLTVLYAGPSLNATTLAAIEQQPALTLLPPIQRGDLPALLAKGFSGTILIADGVFHTTLAVGHIEIRDALAAGCAVYGLASMGAIRAYEMAHMGVQGYGQVYQHFVADDDFQDDEVALLHDNVPPYKPLSEPLVHLRTCLAHMVHNGQLTQAAQTTIITQLKQQWFGNRTLKLFFNLLQQHTNASVASIKNGFNQYRIKQLDLEAMVVGQLWQQNNTPHA